MNKATPISPIGGLESLLPPEMAAKAESVGVTKAETGWRNTIALGVLAGAFIAVGAAFSITVMAGAAGELPFGVTRFLGGLAFSLGLILVMVAGAELFTGNNLIVMAWANHRISTWQVLRNWILVYTGNFVGAIATAFMVFYSEQYALGGGAVGLTLLQAADAKCQLGFLQAVALGMMCNALVCMAVWLCFSARTTTDKIVSIIFPISAFVACGFEHSVANMYLVPAGILVKTWGSGTFWGAAGINPGDFSGLTWGGFFLGNLVPVTIGNIIGGSVMVGLAYWFIYLRKGLVPRQIP